MPKCPRVHPENTDHANADTKAEHAKGRIVHRSDERREPADYQQPKQGERIEFKVFPDYLPALAGWRVPTVFASSRQSGPADVANTKCSETTASVRSTAVAHSSRRIPSARRREGSVPDSCGRRMRSSVNSGEIFLESGCKMRARTNQPEIS